MPQLAALVRAKFPGVYDDLSDADLERQVLAKHPEYKDLATPDYVPAERPRTVMGAGQRVMDENPAPPPNPLMQALQGAAHPQSWGDIASLLIPSALPTRAIRGFLRSTGTAVKEADAAAAPGLSYPLSFAKQGIKGQLRKLNAPGGEGWSPITRDQPPIDRYAPSESGYVRDAPAAEPAMSFGAEEAASSASAAKPHFTVTDVQRIKDLLRQGVSEKSAIEFVQSQKQYPRPVSPDEFFNRR